jgi:hypothetical protein
MSGPFGMFTPLAWFIGVVMAGFTIWWLRQVWTRTALAAAPPDPNPPIELIEPTESRPGPPHLTF